MRYQALLGSLAFFGYASAFSGQMAASALIDQEGPSFQTIYLTDYSTGSTYQGLLWGGFDSCAAVQCSIRFTETSPGGYNFNAVMWRTNDGCHNIDFQGALSAHHGYCCGSLPCNFSA